MCTSEETENPHPHAANSVAAASAPRHVAGQRGQARRITGRPHLASWRTYGARGGQPSEAPPPRPRPFLTARSPSTRMRAAVRVRRRDWAPLVRVGPSTTAVRSEPTCWLLSPICAPFSILPLFLLHSSRSPRGCFPPVWNRRGCEGLEREER